ncbi:MAG: hypothetical protein R3C28_18600 [Pirellulaceae bacterium]
MSRFHHKTESTFAPRGQLRRTISTIAIAYSVVMCGSLETSFAQVTIGPNGITNLNPKWNQPQQMEYLISPAAETVPALKYSLRPDPLQRNPGNAVPFYYRAFALMAGLEQKTQELHEVPFEQRNQDEVAEFLQGRPDQVFAQLREAARREDCDWDWHPEYRGEGYYQFVFPEFDDARNAGRLLALKAEWHLARAEFPEAAEALRLGYCLAQDVAKPEIVVGNLVGISIASQMNQTVQRWIQTPNSPNLYWPLAHFQRPLVSVTAALETDTMAPFHMFPILQNPEAEKLSVEGWRDTFLQLLGKWSLVAGAGPADKDLTETFTAATLAINYPRALKRLSESGYSLDQLRQMPTLQVLAIYQSRVMKRIADDVRKIGQLPPDERLEAAEQVDQKNRELHFRSFGAHSEVMLISELLMNSVYAVGMAEVRLEQQLRNLETIEAIRMHLSETGRLPEYLGQITTVPLPRNPQTNLPFEYRLEGDRAILASPTPYAPEQSTVIQVRER